MPQLVRHRYAQTSATTATIGAGIAAGMIWGLAFLIPVLLSGWSAVTVTAGRYVAYGLLSGALFIAGRAKTRSITRKFWRTAVAFALGGNVGYYLLLVIAIRTVGAPVTDLVIGAIPVVLAVIGNWLRPSYRWRDIVASVVLVSVGLVIVNIAELIGPHPFTSASTSVKLVGLIAAFCCVAAWTWYALANADFLAKHRDVGAATWSTIVGVATGVVTLAALPFAAVAETLTVAGTDVGLARFVVGAAVLGFVVSWLGTRLWNVASRNLSPALAGVLVNIETASGFVYVYAARRQWPPLAQVVGLVCVLLGVGFVLSRTAGRPRDTPAPTPTQSGRTDR